MPELPSFDLEEGDEITAHEIIEQDEEVKFTGWNRQFARRLALQILFEVDCSAHSVGVVLDQHLRNVEATYPNREETSFGRFKAYLHELVTQVHHYMLRFDNVLQVYAAEFPIEQIAIVDRNILRIALYEMFVLRLRSGIVIDQAVELAKIFGAENSARFINGVLGAITDEMDGVRRGLFGTGKVTRDGTASSLSRLRALFDDDDDDIFDDEEDADFDDYDADEEQ